MENVKILTVWSERNNDHRVRNMDKYTMSKTVNIIYISIFTQVLE